MSKYLRIRKRTCALLEVATEADHASAWVDRFIALLIVLNLTAFILVTVPAIRDQHLNAFLIFEIFSLAVFTIEYILRIWSSPDRPDNRSRLAFALRPMMVIDLLAILPSILFFFLGIDLRSLRVLRLLRIIRLSKLGRYSIAFRTLTDVLSNKREELILSVALLTFLLFIASTAIYYAERAAQPDDFGTIPHALYWAAITLTTVGYGDVHPITPVGKLVAMIVSLLGVGFVAIPTGILAAGFSSAFEKRKQAARTPSQPSTQNDNHTPEHQ